MIALVPLLRRWLRPWQGLGVGPVRGRAASRVRRARAGVLAGLALVLASQGWLAAMVETSRPHWRDPEFYHRQRRLTKLLRWERERGHARPLVVILGSSRPQMGLSPEHLALGTGPTDPFVFNCSEAGCHPVGLRVNFSRLLAAGVTPDFVLIEVLPPLLNDAWPTESWLQFHRLGHADLARFDPYLEIPIRVRWEWATARASTWHSARQSLLPNWGATGMTAESRRVDFLWSEMRTYGWSPFFPQHFPPSEREARTAHARTHYRPYLADYRIRDIPARAYRDLLTECRALGIRAALFTMPEAPEFRSEYSSDARERLREYLDGLARSFDVPVFDASGWIDDATAYMDGHHLLGPAAEAFSARLGRECVGPWVAGARR